MLRITLATLALLLTAPAMAAGVNGSVTNTSGDGLTGIQLNLYTDSPKGLTIAYTTNTDRTGSFSFANVAEGTYYLHARMGPGVTGNYSDRWLDVAPPTADGWIAADADPIEIGSSDVTVLMELLNHGGFDGTVTLPRGSSKSGVLIRVERENEPRIHHNDISQVAPHLGNFYIRGLVPGDYHVIAHDPEGQYETAVVDGPFNLVSGANAALPSITLSAMAADPYEPNNTAAGSGTQSIDTALLNTEVPWVTSGALIGPRGSDTDWHCFDALAGERYIAFTTTPILINGNTRDNFFIDLTLALFDESGSRITDDDDSAKGLNAYLDSGPLPGDGRYCFVVSTYGDTGFDGAGQQSAGRYNLNVLLGNRPPTIAGFLGTAPIDVTLNQNEGDTLAINIVASDPDNDALTLGMTLFDKDNNPNNQPDFAISGNRAEFTWDISETAASGAPYSLEFTANDGEFTATLTLDIAVNGINRRPSPPVHLFPEDGTLLPTGTVGLTVENAVDPDGDALTYDYEVYYDSPTGTPVQSGSLPEDISGQTTYNPAESIPENTTVYWRVRAYDQPNNTSFWTTPWTFTVDSSNEAPPPPNILKPSNGEIIIMRSPTFTNEPVADPEGGEVSIVFEVSDKADFSSLLARSRPTPQPSDTEGASWSIDVELEWGNTYHVRAIAEDNFGAASSPGPANTFRIKDSDRPTPAGDFAQQCNDAILTQLPTEFRAINIVTEEPVPVTIEVEVLNEEGEVVIGESVPQNNNTDITTIPIDNSDLRFNTLYTVRMRATIDGGNPSEWSECSFRVGGANPNLNSQGDCACELTFPSHSTSTHSLLAVSLLLGGLLLFRRRRT